MPLTIPPELKPITAYIRRAEELENDKSDVNHQVIAYYCRRYALDKGFKIAPKGQQEFLMNLLTHLETVKKTIDIPMEAEAKVLCEAYAVGVFNRADDEDRGSNDDYREIARMFYNSSTFFDILEQFGALDEEISSKRTYSKWKATEIMKSLKEGKTPTSGGYGGDDAQSTSSDLTTTSATDTASNNMQNLSMGGNNIHSLSLPSTPTGLDKGLPSPISHMPGNFQMPQQPQFGQPQPSLSSVPQVQPVQQYQQQSLQHQVLQPPQHPQTTLQPSHLPSHQPSPNYVPPPKSSNMQSNIADALELCSFAMSSLKHNDTTEARKRLTDALNLLS